MDVLIKGMKMPESCEQCRLWLLFLGQYLCFGNDKEIDNEQFPYEFLSKNRLPDCPLVEVPPHDDLISRRDAIDAVYGYHFNNHPMKELEELTPVIQASEGMENKPYYSDQSCKNNMWDGE